MLSVKPRQDGASFFSIIIMLIIAGIFFTVGFKLFTPYKDHATIKSVVEGVIRNPDEVSQDFRSIRRTIERRFTINQVRFPEKDSLKISRKEGVIHFDIDYEVRVPMFYNVDAVVNFEEHYEVEAP